VRRSVGLAASLFLITAAAGMGAITTSASAAPGSPGVPGDPTVVYDEGFENGLADDASQALRDYTGATGTTYTGSDYWTEPTKCNGIVISQAATDGLGCAPAASVNHLRRMANALGQVNGGTEANSSGNHVVSAYTNGPDASFPLAANDVEFETETPITISGGSRFLTFSVDAASINCGAGAALLSFFLDDGTDELPATNSPINVCTDPGASTRTVDGVNYTAGHFTSDSSVLFSGTSLGIVMRNGYGSGAGNDHAYDNIRVLDATPQLDKSFETKNDPWLTGESADLTFTITNTSELAQKTGWGFTDDLPSGLEVAGAGTTTCAAADITAANGATSIVIENGSIASTIASCTVTIPVTATGAGTFVNGPGNVTTTGLEEPGSTTIVFEEPDPSLEIVKDAALDDVNGNGLADEGETIVYTFHVTNTGNTNLTDVAIEDDRLDDAGVAITPASADLGIGDDVLFTSDPYTVTEDDADGSEIVNVATANGLFNGDPVESDPDSATVDAPGTDDDNGGSDDNGSGILPGTGLPAAVEYALLAGLTLLAAGLMMVRRKRAAGRHIA